MYTCDGYGNLWSLLPSDWENYWHARGECEADCTLCRIESEFAVIGVDVSVTGVHDTILVDVRPLGETS